MWVLIFWMSSPYAGMLGDASQPTLQVKAQEFSNERACKDAFAAIKKLNDGNLVLRGICTPKD